LTNSLTKTKLIDPFILSLVKIIDKNRSILKNLESIDVDSEFTNIVGEKDKSKFYIENQFHKAIGFRKLHVEIAEFSGNLKILHSVFFPDPFFNIPIFGLDVVKVKNTISAAIVDLSPVSFHEKDVYQEKINKLNKRSFKSLREIPEWGMIFSKNVLFASLNDKNEQNYFYSVVDDYLSILVQTSLSQSPDLIDERIEERIYFQKRYCTQQMKNQKTSLVLLNYFEKSWVDKYINKILFDFK
tara:strand:- start:1627 stop:2352 length:726 start_codon:yes stop_codon:yes gene_type:complete